MRLVFLGFLRCAVLGRRSIWAVLRLVAAWQFGTGVLWASVACFVNCTLIRQHPCPRVACYCAFAAQSGGGWWLAGEGARCLSVRGTRTLFRDRAGRGSNPCPGFLPGRTRVTCSRVSHLRDFALLGSVSVTVVRWCLLLHWHYASALLQRASACCRDGHDGRDRARDDRVESCVCGNCAFIIPASGGHGTTGEVRRDARIGGVAFDAAPSQRPNLGCCIDHGTEDHGSRLPPLLWSKPCLHVACERIWHMPVRCRAEPEPRHHCRYLILIALFDELHSPALFAVL